MALNCGHLGYIRYGPLIVGIWGILDMALNCGHLGYIRYGR